MEHYKGKNAIYYFQTSWVQSTKNIKPIFIILILIKRYEFCWSLNHFHLKKKVFKTKPNLRKGVRNVLFFKQPLLFDFHLFDLREFEASDNLISDDSGNLLDLWSQLEAWCTNTTLFIRTTRITWIYFSKKEKFKS